MKITLYEQPLFTAPTCDPGVHGHCATCSDEALPARVLAVDETTGTAVVDLNGQATEIDISLVDKVTVEQMLLVHGGVALGVVG